VPSGAEDAAAARAGRVARGDAALASLRALHERIDREADRLAKLHAPRLQCGRGCSACCLDGLTVASVEAERIRRAHPALLREAEPHAPGACALLDVDGSCRVYADRPSVCRSQGLPLRFFFEDEDDEIEEGRDICPLNLEGGPPLEALAEDDCWLVGPFELELGAIEEAFAGDASRRIPLRDLFARSHALVDESSA
jgi:Fe-S-cluster containining protein